METLLPNPTLAIALVDYQLSNTHAICLHSLTKFDPADAISRVGDMAVNHRHKAARKHHTRKDPTTPPIPLS